MRENESAPVLTCKNLVKTFFEGEREVSVLRSVDFELATAQRVAIVGSSGSGKSTFLHCLGGLDKPTSGEVRVQGQLMTSRSAAERGAIRQKLMGFIYQFHHLLPEFTALENVAMPLLLGPQSIKSIKNRARTFLQKVGLDDRAHHKPSALSGGERQRVAIARALVNEPAVVLADEPTGNLDTENAEQIQALLLELNQALGMSFLVVTHDLRLANQMDQTYRLIDGQLSCASS